MLEENVVSSAGTTYCLDEAVLCRLIRDAGFVPAQRDNTYDILSVKDGPTSPDLLVTDWSEHRARKTHQQVSTKGKQAGRSGAVAALANTMGPSTAASLTISARS
jgi:cyclic dehypoxanthinyl futalosine synthase